MRQTQKTRPCGGVFPEQPPARRCSGDHQKPPVCTLSTNGNWRVMPEVEPAHVSLSLDYATDATLPRHRQQTVTEDHEVTKECGGDASKAIQNERGISRRFQGMAHTGAGFRVTPQLRNNPLLLAVVATAQHRVSLELTLKSLQQLSTPNNKLAVPKGFQPSNTNRTRPCIASTPSPALLLISSTAASPTSTTNQDQRIPPCSSSRTLSPAIGLVSLL